MTAIIGKQALIARGSGGGGVGEETRSEKRCSHKLQSGHLGWWSADNCSSFPVVNILKREVDRVRK